MYSERNPIHLLSQESVHNSGNGNLQFKFNNRAGKLGPFSVSERYENNVKVISSENKSNEDNTNICFKVPHPPSPVRKLLKVIPYFQVNFMSKNEKLLSENESESEHHHHDHGVGVQEESEQSNIIEQSKAKSNSKEERWMETQFLASIRDIGKSFSPNPFHNNVSCSPFLPLALASLCLFLMSGWVSFGQ